MEAPESREPGEEEETILDAAADLEGAGKAPESQKLPAPATSSAEEIDLLAADQEMERAPEKPSPGESLVLRTLVAFVRPGVRGTRINPRRRAEQEICCPSCQAKLVVSKKAAGRQVLCLCCETLIDHTLGSIVFPGPKPETRDQPVDATLGLALPPGASPAESTPALRTLNLPEEGKPPRPGTKAWKDWRGERDRKRKTGKVEKRAGKKSQAEAPEDEKPTGEKSSGRAAEVERTKAVLARFRERAGLAGDQPDPPLARPIRVAGPPPISPFRVAVLVLVAAGLASGATALVLSAADGGGRGAGRSDGAASNGAPEGQGGAGTDGAAAPVPEPREVKYLGYVSEEDAPVLFEGQSAGCRILTQNRVPVWLHLDRPDLEAIRDRVRDRVRGTGKEVCVRGRGTLYSARDPDVTGWVPVGVQVEHVLVGGREKIEFVEYEEFLHTPSDIK
ncbi:MAG: hypothetical protein HY720_13315 [Planctomycetes bacterium]|nr:hypothetical protein [Planctomycetota bacterium]